MYPGQLSDQQKWRKHRAISQTFPNILGRNQTFYIARSGQAYLKFFSNALVIYSRCLGNLVRQHAKTAEYVMKIETKTSWDCKSLTGAHANFAAWSLAYRWWFLWPVAGSVPKPVLPLDLPIVGNTAARTRIILRQTWWQSYKLVKLGLLGSLGLTD